MHKFIVSLLSLSLMQACTTPASKQHEIADNRGYFADASDCYQFSLRKTQVNVPTGNSQTIVEIPLVHDAGVFSNCMLHAGHVVPKADPETYLELSKQCLHEASGPANSDDAYANCIRKGSIKVDVFTEKKAK